MYQFRKRDYENKIYCRPLKNDQKSYRNRNWNYLIRLESTCGCKSYIPSTNDEEIFFWIKENIDYTRDLNIAYENLKQVAKHFNLREITEEEINQ
jgi:hypothetical protein